MTPTATHRQRLEQIRERTHTARAERAKARQLLDAAREDRDSDGQAVAQLAYDRSDEALQVAERLESQLLSSLAGVGVDSSGGGIFEDPRRSRPWSVSVSPRSRSAAWTSAHSARVRS